MLFFPNREMVFRYRVLPPAGDFSRGRKVTKSPLRTNGSKNSFIYYQDRMVRDAFSWRRCTGDACLGHLLLEAPRFGALPWWVDDGCCVYRFFRIGGKPKFSTKFGFLGKTSGKEIAEAITNTKAARGRAERGEPGHPAAASEASEPK